MRPHEIFAANLRAAREQKEFSQEELARRARLHRTEVSLLERAGREPRLETIVRLAHALEIPVAELVRGVDTASASG
jgi:transcriptional regulator with XRE-family HTH domain